MRASGALVCLFACLFVALTATFLRLIIHGIAFVSALLRIFPHLASSFTIARCTPIVSIFAVVARIFWFLLLRITLHSFRPTFLNVGPTSSIPITLLFLCLRISLL